MPLSPAEQNGESTAGDAHRPLPTPFLTKTYQLVDDPSIDDVISWNDDGSTFIVWRPAEFARDLLPKYFKHNNFSSFVRQLNTYGFRKIVPDRWEFANECFKRGEKRLLCDIHRRKISLASAAAPPSIAAAVTVARTGSPSNSGEEQVISSNSSPASVQVTAVGRPCGSAAELVEENERLRKENMHLNQELTQMKNLCNNILVLMSKYASSQSGESGSPAEKPLDLMPLKRFSDDADAGGCLVKSETRPRLFGVPIGAKRQRREEEEEEEQEQEQEEHQQQQAAADVKSEPLDDSSPDHPDRSWLNYPCRINHRVCN